MPSYQIGTSDVNAFGGSQGKKLFYASGRYYAFYSDGTNGGFRSSSDGQSWSSFTSIGAASSGNDIQVAFDGTRFHYARISGNAIYYRSGIPQSGGSITWDGAETVIISAASAQYRLNSAAVDSTGRFLLAYSETNISHHTYIAKNSNLNTSWSHASGFPLQISDAPSMYHFSQVVPLTNGKFYVLFCGEAGGYIKGRLWNGSSLTSAENVSDTICSAYYRWSACGRIGTDDVYLGWNSGAANYTVRVRRYVSGSWETGVDLYQTYDYLSVPTLTANANGEIYAIWLNKPTARHVYYRKYSDGSWGSYVDYLTEASDMTRPDVPNSSSRVYNDKILIAYHLGSSLRFLTIDSPETPPGNPPIADFTASPLTGNAPLEVQFTDLSSGDPDSRQWDFDNDGTVDSTEQNPSHIYQHPGVYSVKLTVSNEYGSDSELKTDYITVTLDPGEGDSYPLGPSSVANALGNTMNPKAWFANGRFFVFYSNGSQIGYQSSLDLNNWTAFAAIAPGSSGFHFQIAYDGRYFHLVRGYDTSNLLYRRGEAYPSGAIIWTPEASVYQGGSSCRPTGLFIDSLGRPVLIYHRDWGVWASINVATNGSWQHAAQFPLKLSVLDSMYNTGTGVPLTDGKWYVVWCGEVGNHLHGRLWDGSSLGAIERPTTLICSAVDRFSLTSSGDDVHLAWNAQDNLFRIYYRKRSGSWLTAQALKSNVNYTHIPCIHINDWSGDIFVVWAEGSSLYYRKFSGGSWSAEVRHRTEVSSIDEMFMNVSRKPQAAKLLIAYRSGGQIRLSTLESPGQPRQYISRLQLVTGASNNSSTFML